MNKITGYIIPILLSDYVETLDDWEIIEWVSRFEETSDYMRNGATYAKHKEMTRVWSDRYPEEPLPLLECVPPLDSELSFLSMCREESEKDNK